MSSHDPDEPNQQTQNYAATQSQPQQFQQQAPTENRQVGTNTGPTTVAPQTLGSIRKFSQKVATISQNYNEKSMLLSSDEEYQ